MRLMIMFDLPTETTADRRRYRQFRKFLLNEGFVMMQYSIYVRVIVNRKSAQQTERRIAAVAPAQGVVQSLMITEAQYQQMRYLAGEEAFDLREAAERTLIL